MIAAETLRAISIDLGRRCAAGEFGGRHSLLRARMDAHSLTIWAAAGEVEEHRRATRREIEGLSPCHKALVRLRGLLGLRRGVRV